MLFADEVAEGRGVLQSIWGWMKYPFSWWWSGETEQPVTGPLLGSSTNNPNSSEVEDIRGHNVTIWCNDQTCNTMKCNTTHCRNITCNIYDTDIRGECREYNIMTDSDELTMPKTTDTTPELIIPSKPTETYDVSSLASNTQEKENRTAAEEHSLALEAVLSSTVNKLNLEKHSESKEDPAIHKTEVSNICCTFWSRF